MINEYQFVPSTKTLAQRAWRKFKNTAFVRVLEPSAGDGDLAEPPAFRVSAHHVARREIPTDVCEIDISRHPTLRSKGLNVVGMDFLRFKGGAIYSHIIMNPPFAEGAKHVLKAWDILWDGEIVAIINAETLRNPFSRERQMLVKLVEAHGEVEFVEGAFASPEAEIKTDVEIALVWLRKAVNVDEDIIGDLLSDLRRDAATDEFLAAGYQAPQSLALPNSLVENSVRAFDAAVLSMQGSALGEAKANYYASLLGDTMAVRNSDGGTSRRDSSVQWVQRTVSERYADLKDRAWAGILRSTNVTSRLSSTAQKRVEAEFENIKTLEFTATNIYGFLHGLVESQGNIQIQMACDVFDQITRYHSDNTVFYKGWKSNDKHRTAGMRIKTTRFILPGHGTGGWRTSADWDTLQQLRDFDKTFAMLDGKATPDVGLSDVFENSFAALCGGERLTSSYFDVRYYPGVGTIHFFARDKQLIDRLNRLVGRQRQWLPPEGTRVSENFWLQFDKAEKFDRELRAELHTVTRSRWDNPLRELCTGSEDEKAAAGVLVDDAMGAVLERHGISTAFQIEGREQAGLPMVRSLPQQLELAA